MPMTPDAFAHHPELRGKITDPHGSFFRTFSVEALVERHPELEPFRDWVHSDAAREQNRRRCLADHPGGDLWVFAYGSLMWDPALDFAEVRRAFADGYARRFILTDDKGGRGTPDAPGLMAALDRGDGCEGLAYRIPAPAIETETEILWRREMIGPGYVPAFVSVRIDGQPAHALTFLADHSADGVCPDLSRADQVRHLARGVGFLGTSRDYLANIVRHFDILGIVDEECFALLQEVDDVLAAESSGGGVQ